MKLNKSEINRIEFDYRNSLMMIFDNRNLLVFKKNVSEAFFNETVIKFYQEK